MPRRSTPKSEYESLVAEGLINTRRRDAALTEEEKAERRRAAARLASEAKRRATAVLIHENKPQYDELYEKERQALRKNPRYVA